MIEAFGSDSEEEEEVKAGKKSESEREEDEANSEEDGMTLQVMASGQDVVERQKVCWR